MNSPQANTKVELVVEAFEALAVAVAVNVRKDASLPDSFADVQDARKQAADALREFLKPVLRSVGAS